MNIQILSYCINIIALGILLYYFIDNYLEKKKEEFVNFACLIIVLSGLEEVIRLKKIYQSGDIKLANPNNNRFGFVKMNPNGEAPISMYLSKFIDKHEKNYDFNDLKKMYLRFYWEFDKDVKISLKNLYNNSDSGKQRIEDQINVFLDRSRRSLNDARIEWHKLSYNRLKYYPILEKIFANRKEIQIVDFTQALAEELNLESDELSSLIRTLSIQDNTGLLDIQNGQIRLWTNKKSGNSNLDGWIDHLNIRITIIESIELNKLLKKKGKNQVVK